MISDQKLNHTMYGAAAGLVLIVIYTNMNFKMLSYIFNLSWYYNNDIRHDIVGSIHNYVSDLFMAWSFFMVYSLNFISIFE